MLVLALFKIWLVESQSVFVISYSGHDDALFLKIANHLLDGQWLGPYDSLTLIKGMFYPVYIAISFLLGIPLLLSQQLLYIAACLVFVFALFPILKKPVYVLILFGGLLFNPISFDQSMLRVLREGIYFSLTLLVMACAFGLILRQDRGWREIWGWALGLGFSLSAFWLTREEGIWLLPALGITVVYALYKIWRLKMKDWKVKSGLWAAGMSVWMLFTLLVSGLNWLNYSVFAKTEYDYGLFKSAYGSMTRVIAGDRIPFVPVSRQMRKAIYKVSPAFSELRPYLEGELGRGWAENGAKNPENRREILGGWFVWAFRDSVANAGYYSSGRFPADFYRRMTGEIDEACNRKTLDCLPKRSTILPPLQFRDMRELARKFIEDAQIVIRFENIEVGCPSKNLGSAEDSWIFRDLTHEPFCSANIETRISGWVIADKGTVNLDVRGRGAGDPPVGRSPRPDLSGLLSKQGMPASLVENAGFQTVNRCAFPCSLLVSSDRVILAEIPFSKLTDEKLIETNGIKLYVDDAETQPLEPQTTKWNDIKEDILARVLGLLQSFHLPLLGLAFLAYLYLTAIQVTRKTMLEIWAVATILAATVILRVLFVALFEITSYPSTFTGYYAPAYAPVLAFAWIVICGMLDQIGESRRTFTRNTRSEQPTS
jgi:hypothetical protein